jgi:hypothetical protein
MNEWTLDIETASGVPGGADDLERFARALDTDTRTTGAAASINSRTGVVSATFTIEAPDAVQATELGVRAFRDALSGSGLAPGEPARIAVELVPLNEKVPA